MKRVIALALAVAMIFALAACGSSSSTSTSSGTSTPVASDSSTSTEAVAEPITIKIATGMSETHPIVQALKEVKTYVEEQSGGSVILDLYVAGVLGSNSEIAGQMISGEIDAVIAGACDNFASSFTLRIFRSFSAIMKLRMRHMTANTEQL